MSQIAFIRNNKVVKLVHPLAIVRIAKLNRHTDWQARVLIEDSVDPQPAIGWDYNEEDKSFTPPST